MIQEIVERGVQDLKTDFTNGARVLAMKAVRCLHDALPEPESAASIEPDQLKDGILTAGYELSIARPSMGAAITSAIITALHAVWKNWAKHYSRNQGMKSPPPSTMALLENARAVLEEQLERRRQSGKALAEKFAKWLLSLPPKPDGTIRLLTLSDSSTLRQCLVTAVHALAAPTGEARKNTKIELRILESRPACEGADFAVRLRSDMAVWSSKFVRVTLAPDSHVCMLAKDIDAVLLGADRISQHGDVSNKTGSLAAAVCARALSPTSKVVVLSETDKIAKPGEMDEHAAESGDAGEVMGAWKPETSDAVRALGGPGGSLDVENVHFEWVPWRYVDTYITEEGAAVRSNISQLSQQKKELEEYFFGQFVE